MSAKKEELKKTNQIYDFKGFKQEGLFIRRGMMQGLKNELREVREELTEKMEEIKQIKDIMDKDFDKLHEFVEIMKEMQQDMDAKMDVLINIQKNDKLPFQNQPKKQPRLEQIGKTDKDSHVVIADDPDGVSLASDKMVVPSKPRNKPLESLHSCQSCETFTPCLGAFFTLVAWSCFLIYLFFNLDEIEYVLPT